MREESTAWERGQELRRLCESGAPGWLTVCLETALEDGHPFLRAEAALALQSAPDESVVPALARALESSENAVRWRAERLLIRREPRVVLRVLEEEARSGEGGRRLRAVEAMGRLGPEALEPLQRLSHSDEVKVRARVAKACGAIDEVTALELVIGFVDDAVVAVRRAALRALVKLLASPRCRAALGDDTSSGSSLALLTDALLRELEGDDDEARRLVLEALARIGSRLSPHMVGEGQKCAILAAWGESSLAQLTAEVAAHLGVEAVVERALDAEERSIRCVAISNSDNVERLLELLNNGDAAIRQTVVRALGRYHHRRPVEEALRGCAADADEGVRWMVSRALAGEFDAAGEGLRRDRLPSEAPSAQWPFGLPAPQSGEPARPSVPLAVAVVNHSYNLNLGVLVRSIEAAGARELFIVGRDFHHRVAAMGADRWVPIRVFDTASMLVGEARSLGYQLVAVQQAPGSVRFDQADYPPRPCLMLGAEGPGLLHELCAQADLLVEIPQRGVIDSLNVATAGTLVLWACLANRGWL